MRVLAKIVFMSVVAAALPGCGHRAPGVEPWVGLVDVPGSVNGLADKARLSQPTGIVRDQHGNLYVACAKDDTIRKVTPAGEVVAFVGEAQKFGQTDGLGESARFNFPQGLALDAAGNVYVADAGNNAVRRITPAGQVSTVAGFSAQRGAVNGKAATSTFNHPQGVAVDHAGNVYVADTLNSLIRRIGVDGQVSTVAGQTGVFGHTDGAAASAKFSSPSQISFDAHGNLLVVDSGNKALRKISPNGTVTTIQAFTVVKTDKTTQQRPLGLEYPTDVVADADDNLYVTDAMGYRVIKIAQSGEATVLVARSDRPEVLSESLGYLTGIAIADKKQLMLASGNAVLVTHGL